MGVGHPFISFRSIYPVPVCYQVHTIGTEYGIIGTRRFDLVPPVLTADMTKGPVFFVSARVKKKKNQHPRSVYPVLPVIGKECSLLLTVLGAMRHP